MEAEEGNIMPERRELLYMLDALHGGDITKGSVAAQGIIDGDLNPSKETTDRPAAFDHPQIAAIREKGGARPETSAEIKSVMTEIKSRLGNYTDTLQYIEDVDRRGFLVREAREIRLLFESCIEDSQGDPVTKAGFIERTKAVTGNEPRLYDSPELRERMRELLGRRGYAVSNPNSKLWEVFRQWQFDRGTVPSENLADMVRRQLAAQVRLMKERVFSSLDFRIPNDPHLINLDFLKGTQVRNQEGIHYDMAFIYNGGNDENGQPAQRGFVELNPDFKGTPAEVAYIARHEFGGHVMEDTILDHLLRNKIVGREGEIITLQTGRYVMSEGLAQSVHIMPFNGSIDQMVDEIGGNEGLDAGIAALYSWLQDDAKANTSFLAQIEGWEDARIDEYLLEHSLLSEGDAAKMKKQIWRRSRTFAPMYGPAYALGRRTFHDEMYRHGVSTVARTAFHLDGVVDIHGFQEKLARHKMKA